MISLTLERNFFMNFALYGSHVWPPKRGGTISKYSYGVWAVADTLVFNIFLLNIWQKCYEVVCVKNCSYCHKFNVISYYTILL